MKTCTTCGETKRNDAFPTKGHRCNTCLNKAAWLAKKAKSKKVVHTARHPWEALGMECRPNWSKI